MTSTPRGAAYSTTCQPRKLRSVYQNDTVSYCLDTKKDRSHTLLICFQDVLEAARELGAGLLPGAPAPAAAANDDGLTYERDRVDEIYRVHEALAARGPLDAGGPGPAAGRPPDMDWMCTRLVGFRVERGAEISLLTSVMQDVAQASDHAYAGTEPTEPWPTRWSEIVRRYTQPYRSDTYSSIINTLLYRFDIRAEQDDMEREYPDLILELCPRDTYDNDDGKGGSDIEPLHGCHTHTHTHTMSFARPHTVIRRHYVFQPPGGPIPAGQRCATCRWVYNHAETRKVYVWSMNTRVRNMMRHPVILEVSDAGRVLLYIISIIYVIMSKRYVYISK
jgi:hypothetical protein